MPSKRMTLKERFTSCCVGASRLPSTSDRPASWSITAKAIGNIIIVVAVFEIHIDKNAVATMNPKTKREGAEPTRRIVCSASRLCRLHRSIAKATMKPPMYKKTM